MIFRDYPEAYAYRILDHDGRVVDAANAGLVPPRSGPRSPPPTPARRPFSMRGAPSSSGRRRSMSAAGRRGSASPRSATPSRLVLFVFFDELFVHVFVALLPFAACLVLVNIVTVRQSLRPLIEAARAARETGHGTTTRRLPTAGLPAEILDMVEAINDASAGSRMRSRPSAPFTAEAAHALRTRLAVLSAPASRNCRSSRLRGRCATTSRA